ncbi:MAG: FtsX-like permease family protein [Rhodothermales bacterium]|nr:FtsX-like permease family protein [Rhodothermales bacterium]
MSVCLLIFAFIWDQKSYDDFHEDADRIYRVLSERITVDGDVNALAATPAPLAAVLAEELPGIEAITRIGQIRSQGVYEGKALPLTGLHVEPEFFDIFDFRLVSGSPQTLLQDPSNLLITEIAAVKLFGDADPLGKTISLEGFGDFSVSAIVAMPTGKSHLQFEILAPFASIEGSSSASDLTDWDNSSRFATYLRVADKATAKRLDDFLPTVAERQYSGADVRLEFHVQALGSISLGPVLGNEIASYSVPALFVYFLSFLGIVIISVASFNYVSLSFARSMRRAQEIGVRKAMGAVRQQVFLQFISESVIVAFLGMLGAVIILFWLLPAFNSLWFSSFAGIQFEISLLAEPLLLATFILFSLAVGVLAGFIPALRLSRFLPVQALKGKLSVAGSGRRWFRNGLSGVQFGVALFFVTTTVFLYAQLQHLLTADYGFASDNIINVDLQGQEFGLFRDEMLRHASITSVSATSTLPASGSTRTVEVRKDDDSVPVDVIEYSVDPAFLDNLEFELVAGRNFSDQGVQDTSSSIVLNETAVQILGMGSPSGAIGSLVTLGSSGTEAEIIGVVKDYHYDTLTDPISGMMWRYLPEAFRYANVRANNGMIDEAEAHVEEVWSRLDPVHPATYEEFNEQLVSSPLNRTMKDLFGIIGVVALLALVVSCLGLLGMAVYSVEVRVKEVGIRKVLGATRMNIAYTLSKDYLRLVILAAVIVTPLVGLFSKFWLQAFSNHIDVEILWLVGCAVVMAMIATGVIATQTVRAADADPILSLRYE